MTSDRAPPGRPAGIVSRVLAAAIDGAVVMLMCGGAFLTVVGVRFVLSPLTFQWPTPSWALSLLVAAVLAAGYLTVGWAVTGRTYGAAVLGLRVCTAGGGSLGWPRAGLRAVLCVMIPVGLLWVAVSPRRRSVQDVMVLTVVVYDWQDDAGLRRAAGPAESPVAGVGGEQTTGRLPRVADDGEDRRPTARVEYYDDPAAPAPDCLAPSAFAVVRDDADRVLLVRRADDGRWELPGGRVELGESAVEAVERAVGAESGLIVKVTALAGVYTDPAHVVVDPATGEARQQFAVCFHALPVAGEPRPDGGEISEAAWVSADRLDKLPMHPAVRRRLAHAIAAPNHSDIG
jgi:ADP-ribose pyrophosphatase YjhB (NUDIX family)/uncharacterized RDD family membrane protein YckC